MSSIVSSIGRSYSGVKHAAAYAVVDLDDADRTLLVVQWRRSVHPS
jgi:hypothetical protein